MTCTYIYNYAYQSYLYIPFHSSPIETSELWYLSGNNREDYQNCSVLYCVLKLCAVISTLRRAVLTVLWMGFCHTGPISLCIDLLVSLCVYLVCFCFILHSCCTIVSTVGWTWWDWSVILRTYLPSVLWHCWLGHLTRKNPSPIWPIMCLMGHQTSLYLSIHTSPLHAHVYHWICAKLRINGCSRAACAVCRETDKLMSRYKNHRLHIQCS